MRHFKMTCQQSRDFVKRKRPIICPNAAFTEQLEVWEKCRFDLQNRSIVDQGPIPDPVGLNRTTEGTKGGTEGGEEAKQEVPTIQEEAFKKEGGQEAKTINEEVVKELEERKEIADEAGKGREGQENANGDEEYKSKDKDDNVQEDDDKGDKHAEASRICEVNHPTDLSKPPKIDSGLGLDSPSSIVAKSHKPQNVDDDSTTADDIHDGIDISATGLPTPPHTPPRAPTPPPAPTPAPEIIRAAIEPLYSKYPAMGKKKLLRILNAEQGWNIGSKEFRSHLEAISGGTGTERGDDGDLISHCRVAIV